MSEPISRAHGTREELGAQLREFLRPGMTAVAVALDPLDAEVLQRNAERTGGGRIEVIEAAAWSEPGAAADGVRLDDVLPADVDLLLLGTQASAHGVLRGARRLLERSRPLVLVEFSPQRLREAGTDPVAAIDGYRALGWRAVGTEGELPADPGELVRAVEATERGSMTLRLEPVDPSPPLGERLLTAGQRLGRTWARRFPPQPPRTLAYDATHRALVSAILDSDDWNHRFANGGQLPQGLGVGFDERVVEYPWLFSRGLSGRVLDAGSVLNHRHLVERLLPRIDDLTIATLAPEPVAFSSFGISYLYADLRELPLRDHWFDEVVCLSTLEHVGMDNTVYGAAGEHAADPDAAAAQALRELLRVVRPGGRVHLSLPFGRREDHGWFRQLNREDVDRLLAEAEVNRHEEAVFRQTPRGWRRSTAKRVADYDYNTASERAADGAVGARAVLCATIYT